MTHLKSVLIAEAELVDEIYWRAHLAIAVPDATEVAIGSALQAMSLWRDATNPVSRAFAGHALDQAVRYLREGVVA